MAAFPLPDRMKDFTGHKFGKLAVTQWAFKKNDKWYWICECACGATASIPHCSLLANKTKSCGCRRVESAIEMGKANATHGDVQSAEWLAWKNMKDRCYNSNNNSYGRYGERGIVVCDRWLGEEGYAHFLEDMGRRPSDKHSLDRIDYNGNYEPSNCRWATATQQQRNRSSNVRVTAFGKTQTCSEWAEETGLSLYLICRRINQQKWDPEKALTTPPIPRGQRHIRQRNTP